MSSHNYFYPKEYDVIVVGAGHAGCEAALAAARMGSRALLITANCDTIAQMSCNPAIGGLAKGHIVREIDALGGEMARNIDETGIQFRLLNRKKGPAVWASRAQADKCLYRSRMKRVIEEQPGLDLKQEMVCGIEIDSGRVTGVSCATGNGYRGRSVIITAGTFLNGTIHIGENSFASGRAGEPPSVRLADNLRRRGLRMGRLKTGTPPRVNLKDIEVNGLTRQDGDEPPIPFSFGTKAISLEQVPCYITHTSRETREIITDNLDRSPLYGGKIKGIGVRYCPSIEDKIIRFPLKETHQVFIEPEGRYTKEAYLNGLSTSLPYDVQLRMIRSVRGLEKAEIVRPGYAIEYDYVFPTQLDATLETKEIDGLFLAGQINGTSGYEEAAAQGIMAGINAALRVKGKSVFTLDRSEAYIGVLIDDLVTKGTKEPYRMFTSRAEYRLFLRQDNADIRLARYGHEFGLIGKESYEKVERKKRLVDEGLGIIRRMRQGGCSVEQMLRRPGARYKSLRAESIPELPDYDEEVIEQIEIAAKYAGYLRRQIEEIARFKKMEGWRIPPAIDYGAMKGLKKEAIEKLQRVSPVSVGQAARISGITPADISVLTIWLTRSRRATMKKM